MWINYIKTLCGNCKFEPPAAESEIDETEKVLDVKLPDELRELFKETDGVSGDYGLGLIWAVEKVRNDNIEFRTTGDFKELYMPFDCLLFFADAGNGDQFAFSILDGEVRRSDVFVWNHENVSRTWAASSLKQYLDWGLTGKLEI